MAAKFWNIVKANAEIERLTSENSNLAKELSDFRASIEGNNAETVAALEKLQGEHTALLASTDALNTAGVEATKKINALEADLKAANEKLANPDARVKELAAIEAAKITAAQGQPPLKVQPANNPAAAPAKTDLKGRERSLAAVKVDGVPANDYKP